MGSRSRLEQDKEEQEAEEECEQEGGGRQKAGQRSFGVGKSLF